MTVMDLSTVSYAPNIVQIARYKITSNLFNNQMRLANKQKTWMKAQFPTARPYSKTEDGILTSSMPHYLSK